MKVSRALSSTTFLLTVFKMQIKILPQKLLIINALLRNLQVCLIFQEIKVNYYIFFKFIIQLVKEKKRKDKKIFWRYYGYYKVLQCKHLEIKQENNTNSSFKDALLNWSQYHFK